MPDMDGLEATSALKRNNPTTSVLILTMHDNADLLLNALKAGAAGYILKTANETDLRAGIHEALAGELPIDRHMTRQLLERLAHHEHQHAGPATMDRDRNLGKDLPIGSL